MAKIKGSNGNDTSFGTNKADVIFGRGGDDTISGPAGPSGLRLRGCHYFDVWIGG